MPFGILVEQPRELVDQGEPVRLRLLSPQQEQAQQHQVEPRPDGADRPRPRVVGPLKPSAKRRGTTT
jgi:hypothetical protein